MRGEEQPQSISIGVFGGVVAIDMMMFSSVEL